MGQSHENCKIVIEMHKYAVRKNDVQHFGNKFH